MAQKKEKITDNSDKVENLKAETQVAKKAAKRIIKPKETPEESLEPDSNEVNHVMEETKLEDSASINQDRSALFLGIGLLVFGALLLLGRLLSIPIGSYVWPFVFIIPGVMLFATSLSSDSGSAEGLSIFSGILTALGLLFLAQTITGLWATWAYAWAFVAPISVGISQMIFGRHKNRESIYESGLRVTRVGLWLLLAGFIFFELIIGISGFGLSQLGLPVMPMVLIFAGIVILVRSLIRAR